MDVQWQGNKAVSLDAIREAFWLDQGMIRFAFALLTK